MITEKDNTPKAAVRCQKCNKILAFKLGTASGYLQLKCPIPVFVDMSQSEYLTAIYLNKENPLVFAVAVNAPNKEVIQIFVDFLIKG